jgi:methyl-accepting chemotaxis protein
VPAISIFPSSILTAAMSEMARTVEVFKGAKIETNRLRAEQGDAEQRQMQQRKADMHRLADGFETAVGEIIETVSSASTELEASAPYADRDGGSLGAACHHGCGRFR